MLCLFWLCFAGEAERACTVLLRHVTHPVVLKAADLARRKSKGRGYSDRVCLTGVEESTALCCAVRKVLLRIGESGV